MIGGAKGIGLGIDLGLVNQYNRTGSQSYIEPEVLDSLVGVWSAYGMTNDSPNRSTIKNKIPNAGGDFELLNFAYKLNSGFGKYEISFKEGYRYNNSVVKDITDESFNFDTEILIALLYKNIKVGESNDEPSYKIKVSNLSGKLRYYYINDKGSRVYIEFTSNGEYTLPISYDSLAIENTWIGFSSYSASSGTIEQILSFQGALVTDGVNDLITSTKTVQEMLGGSTELTVVTMMCNLTNNKFTYNNQIIPCVEGFIRTRFTDKSGGKLSISGYTIKNINYNANITSSYVTDVKDILGDKNDFSKDITNGKLDGIFSVEGYRLNNGTIYELSQVAWYWTFIAKRALTTDEINQVIAYYNLDKYVKPDIYYDVKKQGLTNDIPDADWYLKDFSGNGRDMQLYNYSKTPESGINEEGGLQSDGITDYGKAENLPIYKDYTVVADREIVDGLINNADGGVATRDTSFNNGAFCFDFQNSVFSFGSGTSKEIDIKRFISYQSKYINNGLTISAGDIIDTNPLCIARLGSTTNRYSKLALWSFLLFPYSLSEFLLERQLKRYKLGTLYLDMVEFRPIVKSNVEYNKIVFHSSENKELQVGNYYPISSQITIYIRLSSITDEVKEIIINGVPASLVSLPSDNVYQYRANLNSKSPQKIDITIDEYIRYEDIVQPYPTIFRLIDIDSNKEYTYGDKLKVGTKVKIASVSNLLPELYSPVGTGVYNGNTAVSGNVITVEKTMVFGWSRPFTYLKDNEPNCIADPQRLRIPNSSYKILGYIPDISGHGNHLKINNSAYAGMSGANGYKYDYKSFLVDKVLAQIDDDRKATYFAVKNSVGFFNANSASYKGRIKLTGVKKAIKDNFIDVFQIYTNSPTDNEAIYIYEDGIYDVNIKGADDATRLYFFALTTHGLVSTLNTPIVIEQIGEYEGSFCLDGVDDFITIPTLASGAKQVLMKVNTQNMNGVLYDQRKSSGSPWYFAVYNTTEADSVAYAARNTNGKTYIDGVLNANITCQQLLNITHNLTVTNNGANEQNTQSPVIGASKSDAANFSKMALFTFMSFDEISSENEIKELNDIVGIEGGYVESPDYYWDAYGKSNRATQDIDYLDLNQASNAHQVLIDKSKAGLAALELYHNTGNVTELINRRLNANNFAFNEESGYGGISTIYKFSEEPIGNQWQYYSDRVSFEILDNGNNARITEVKSGAGLFYIGNPNKKAYYKITGVSVGKGIKFGNDNSTISVWSKVVEEDGVYEIDWSLNISTNGTRITACIMANGWRGECDIIIEQVSQYPNGLVSDGVEDNLKNTNMPVLTDYTWIMKRERLDDRNSVMAYKGDSEGWGAFAFELLENAQYTRSFSASNNSVEFPSLISYQTKNNYNGKTINAGAEVDGSTLYILRSRDTFPYYCKAVFYKAMLYSKTIDMLSINMLKNLFERDELIDVNNPIFKK